MSEMPRMKVTLKEWAEACNYDLDTVKGWRKRAQLEFPEPVEWRGGGPTPYWWDTDLDRWKKAHPTLGLGRGGHKRPLPAGAGDHQEGTRVEDPDGFLEVIEIFDQRSTP